MLSPDITLSFEALLLFILSVQFLAMKLFWCFFFVLNSGRGFFCTVTARGTWGHHPCKVLQPSKRRLFEDGIFLTQALHIFSVLY